MTNTTTGVLLPIGFLTILAYFIGLFCQGFFALQSSLFRRCLGQLGDLDKLENK